MMKNVYNVKGINKIMIKTQRTINSPIIIHIDVEPNVFTKILLFAFDKVRKMLCHKSLLSDGTVTSST